MPELQPIDQWFKPIKDSSEVHLSEPTGEPYDPNSLPPWLNRTGVDYLRANPDQIRLTFFFSMQQSAADLGPQGGFEEQIKAATIFGDRMIAASYQRPTYANRIADGLGSQARPVFDTGNPDDPIAAALAGGIRTAFLRRLQSNSFPPRAQELSGDSAALRHENIIKAAAAAMLMHVLDWSVLDTVGRLATNEEGPHHAVVSLKPINLDLVRKAATLGLVVDARCISEDEWPIEVVRETQHVQSTLATGRFNTAGL